MPRKEAYDDLLVFVIPEKIDPKVTASVSGSTLFKMPFQKFSTAPITDEVLFALLTGAGFRYRLGIFNAVTSDSVFKSSPRIAISPFAVHVISCKEPEQGADQIEISKLSVLESAERSRMQYHSAGELIFHPAGNFAVIAGAWGVRDCS